MDDIIQNRRFKSIQNGNEFTSVKIEKFKDTYKVDFETFTKLLKYDFKYCNFYFNKNEHKYYLMAI